MCSAKMEPESSELRPESSELRPEVNGGEIKVVFCRSLRDRS